MLQLPCGKKLGEVPEPRSYAWLRWEFPRSRACAEAVNSVANPGTDRGLPSMSDEQFLACLN